MASMAYLPVALCATLAVFLSACVVRPVLPPMPAEIPGWLDVLDTYDYSGATEFPDAGFVELLDDESVRGLERLREVKYAMLTREQVLAEFPAAARSLPPASSYLLARASSDLGNGRYSVYLDAQGRLNIAYGQLGGCGEMHRRAMLIAAEALSVEVVQVGGGCHAAL